MGAPATSQKILRIIGVVTVIVIGLFILGWMHARHYWPFGWEQGKVIYAKNGVLLCDSQIRVDQATALYEVQDHEALAQMVMKGQAFLVPEKSILLLNEDGSDYCCVEFFISYGKDASEKNYHRVGWIRTSKLNDIEEDGRDQAKEWLKKAKQILKERK